MLFKGRTVDCWTFKKLSTPQASGAFKVAEWINLDFFKDFFKDSFSKAAIFSEKILWRRDIEMQPSVNKRASHRNIKQDDHHRCHHNNNKSICFAFLIYGGSKKVGFHFHGNNSLKIHFFCSRAYVT